MARTVCIATGPVFGLQSKKFLEETAAFAASIGKQVKVFRLFDEIFRLQRRVTKNAYEDAVAVGELLDGYSYEFDLLRRNAWCSIARQMDQLPDDVHVVIRTPASIRWREVNIELKDHRVIAETVAPDRIVTLINAEWKILERLKSEYGQAVRRLIFQQEQEPDVAMVLDALGTEVSVSEDWAEWCSVLTGKDVRHYVMGVEAPSREDRSVFVRDVDNMTKAATEPDLPSFYASYSMTVGGEKERDAINAAVWRLREHGLVIDPGTIEIGGTMDPRDEPVVFAYTVFRDLRWDVKKVDVVAAFHPYEDPKTPPPLSTGMMDELGHARAFYKDRYLVLPQGAGSPFTAGTFIPKNHTFKHADEFFDFIEKKRRPQIPLRFKDQVAAFAKWNPPAKEQAA
jgi:hypothetical protein